MVMVGLAAVKAFTKAAALATSAFWAPWRNVMVTAPALAPPSLLPRLPALQPAKSSAPAVPAATTAKLRRAFLVNFMEPPLVG